jgi:hypothetical protein
MSAMVDIGLIAPVSHWPTVSYSLSHVVYDIVPWFWISDFRDKGRHNVNSSPSVSVDGRCHE